MENEYAPCWFASHCSNLHLFTYCLVAYVVLLIRSHPTINLPDLNGLVGNLPDELSLLGALKTIKVGEFSLVFQQPFCA